MVKHPMSVATPLDPISPPPLRRPAAEHLPAYLSNGLLGLRVGTVPLIEGLAIVGGLRGVDPVNAVEAFARGPYPFAGDIEIDGHWLSRLPSEVAFVEQRYDFSCGELHSHFEFRTERVVARIEVLNFCSRSLPTAVLQEIRVRVDHSCRLSVRAGLNHTGVPGRIVARRVSPPGKEKSVAHGSLLWATHGDLAECGVAYTTTFSGGESVEEVRSTDDILAPLATTYSLRGGRVGGTFFARSAS